MEEYPGYSGWAQYNHRGPLKRQEGKIIRDETGGEKWTPKFGGVREDGVAFKVKSVREARNAGSSQQLERDRKRFAPMAYKSNATSLYVCHETRPPGF